MDVIDNISRLLGDDLKQTLKPGARLKIAASCFSMYAYEALKSELEQIGELEFIFTSPNFRNNDAFKDRETRYQKLLNQVVRQGIKTKVLMLSATPVNNRLADLRNQIAFVTEGDDTALFEHGIASIDSTTRRAQKAFNRWLEYVAAPNDGRAWI